MAENVLGTIFSRADALKRQLYDMIRNPSDYASMVGGRTQENMAAAQALQNQAFADPQNPLRITNPQALSQLTQMITSGPMGFAPMGVTKAVPTPSGLLEDVSYRGTHTAPNASVYGATLDDLTKIMPKDVYTQQGKNLYGIGDRTTDSEWYMAALKAKGKPDADVTVYRAVPKGIKEINPNDWVTTSPTYAKWHGENVLDGEYEIIKKTVKAKTLSTEGYPYEFGYNSD